MCWSVRPGTAITTPIFSQQWTLPTMPMLAISVPGSSVKTLPQFMSVLQEQLHIHPVEMIVECTSPQRRRACVSCG
jgi:hypothetical protein